jgi:hypothetical protein
MTSFAFLKKSMLVGLLCSYSFSLQADLPGSTPTKTSSKPMLQSPTPTPKDEHPKQPRLRPLVKPELPPMIKPFGMPGVIGIQNGKWEGTDYLGSLSNNIGISVEILKNENVPSVVDASSIEAVIAETFTKEDINPNAEVTQGPPLPFLHVLILIYPIDKDHYVIFGNGRLFEQIQVVRKDFVPSGFWQGITWENQDVTTASVQQLDAQVRTLAGKIGSDFAKRYRQYNLSKEGMPPSSAPSLH